MEEEKKLVSSWIFNAIPTTKTEHEKGEEGEEVFSSFNIL